MFSRPPAHTPQRPATLEVQHFKTRSGLSDDEQQAMGGIKDSGEKLMRAVRSGWGKDGDRCVSESK